MLVGMNAMERVEANLSHKHQKIYKEIPTFLQALVSNTFFSSDAPHAIKISQLILDIIGEHSYPCDKKVEEFFTVFLTMPSNDIHDDLMSILTITQHGCGELFWTCCSTQKQQYYSLSELKEIIQSFESILPYIPVPIPVFKPFLPYNRGGKELLIKIIKTPSKIDEIVHHSVKMDSQKVEKYSIKTLSQMTGNFDQIKSYAIRYIASLHEKNRLSIDIYLKLLNGLQNQPEYKKFNFLEKKGIVLLILITTTDTINPVTGAYHLEHLQDLLLLLLEIHEECGEEIIMTFSQAPTLYQGALLSEVIRALQLIKILCKDIDLLDDVMTLLSLFFDSQFNLSKLISRLERLREAGPANAHLQQDLDTLDALFKRFSGSDHDPHVKFPLSLEKQKEVRAQYEKVHAYCEEFKQFDLSALVTVAREIQSKTQKDENDLLKLTAIGRLAIFLEFGMYLYHTQICAVLSQLTYPKGSVAQVKTGEGKTKEVTLLAFILIMKGAFQGHIISSSPSLAIRDQEEHIHFFKKFGIKTSHICERSPLKDRFQADILYGTATDFEFAIMREMLYFEKLFPQEKPLSGQRFDWVIVDEIDNLTIDTSRSGARLATEAQVTYDWVYIPIFQFVKMHFNENDIALTSSEEWIKKLRSRLETYHEGKFADHVSYFLDKKLSLWMKSAFSALFDHQEKRDYIIGVGESAYGKKVNQILIIDVSNTGRVMHGMRWQAGVHEFLEVKHGLDVSRENISPISLSHPVFYTMYRSLFGITGTIGSHVEREELKEVYDIHSFDVPTHLPPQRKDKPIVLVKTREEYLQLIIRAIKECKQQKRPLLVLCYSIEETEIIAKQLDQEQIVYELLNEAQKKTEEEVIRQAGLAGSTTLATNTAGRGTDIKLSEESLMNGGLHVIITFYPESERVELQAKGRAGRQGQPGSSEMILLIEKIEGKNKFAHLSHDQIISHLQEERQLKAIQQKASHLCHAEVERAAFKLKEEFYQMLHVFHEISSKDFFSYKIANFLKNRRFLKKVEREFKDLGPKEKQMAQEVLKLLNQSNSQITEWEVIIQQLIERVKDHIINEFAVNFHSLIVDLEQDSRVMLSLMTLELIKESQKKQSLEKDFSEELSNLFLEHLIKEKAISAMNLIKQEMTQAFNQQKEKWNRYFNPSGQGIIEYINLLLHVKLGSIQ
ncbi:hypothetical protein [Rhabdochlamydiaceae symbiont of Dictyostelium giganteum]|uniref:preprotein translocase subunit SecA n=1 Tax=Rhabdochlamydiaceae symbiont of Dictyostelium giganteum TaxID=3342349 RepID=UPI00384A9FE2